MGARTHDPHGASVHTSSGAAVAEEVAQDRAFKRRRRGGTTLARPWQIDREVERFRRPRSSAPVGESHRFSDVVGHEDGGEALVMPHPLQQPLHGNARQRVQGAERLVECQHAQPAD